MSDLIFWLGLCALKRIKHFFIKPPSRIWDAFWNWVTVWIKRVTFFIFKKYKMAIGIKYLYSVDIILVWIK